MYCLGLQVGETYLQVNSLYAYVHTSEESEEAQKALFVISKLASRAQGLLPWVLFHRRLSACFISARAPEVE